MTFTLLATRPEAEGVFSFLFQPPKHLRWKAGQYLAYTLPHPDLDKRGIKRYFSIASAPFEKNVMITTRIEPNKGSSFKKALMRLPQGASIDGQGPNGSFVLEDPTQEFVFIAGGIGITPFRAMLLDLAHKKIPIKGTLLYASKTPRPVFHQELQELSAKHSTFKLHSVVEPQRVTPKILQKLIPDFSKPSLAGSKPQFYLSGPPAMMQTIEGMLGELGVPSSQIKEDYFTGYADP